ncbi:hypothetical protein [Alteriqipengyuania sp. 357]
MKIRNLAAAAAALSLVAAPAVAEVSFDRTSAPVEGESEIGGAPVLGALAVAAIIAGVLVATDVIGDDDDGVSA